MKKTLILSIFVFLFSSAECIQVIRRGNSQDVENFNNQQYEQQLMREEIETQKEILRVQKEQLKYLKSGR